MNSSPVRPVEPSPCRPSRIPGSAGASRGSSARIASGSRSVERAPNATFPSPRGRSTVNDGPANWRSTSSSKRSPSSRSSASTRRTKRESGYSSRASRARKTVV